MSHSKFTPGPWEIDYDNADERSEGQWFVVGPAEVHFEYNCTEKEHDTATANAKLIAAAPEMYELVLQAASVMNKYYRNLDGLGEDGHDEYLNTISLLEQQISKF